MPEYVAKAPERFQHPKPKIPQYSRINVQYLPTVEKYKWN